MRPSKSIANRFKETQIIDPNVNTTTYVYDGLGRFLTDTNQLGKTRTYKYDAIGNQIEVIDRNNLSRTFEYDTLNRQTKENWVSGARSITYQYNVLNQLIDVTDLSGTSTKQSQYAYGYDDLDRIKSIATPIITNFPPVIVGVDRSTIQSPVLLCLSQFPDLGD
jgi:YD repeat-containing protein